MRGLRAGVRGQRAVCRSVPREVRVKDTLARIDHSVWELGKLVAKHPESITLRADFLKFFHESRIFVERKAGVSDADRSFLLLQDREALCCVLLHGAGGTPAEMRPLAEHLFKAGYTVYGVRLALGTMDNHVSHGAARGASFHWRKLLGKEKGKQRDGYNWERSLFDAEVVLGAVLTFSPNTYAVGFSFGGTIALNLLQGAPLKGAVLISPALFPAADGRYLTFRVVRSALRCEGHRSEGIHARPIPREDARAPQDGSAAGSRDPRRARQGRLAEEPSFPQGCRREPEVALRAHPERPARSREG